MASPGDEEDLKFLSGKTLIDGTPSSWLEDPSGKFVQIFIRNDKCAWTAEQTWGFEEIGGVRHYTRRLVVRKGDVSRKSRQIYDFKSEYLSAA